jgi:hypothetical protein
VEARYNNPDDPESCSAAEQKAEGVAVELADAVNYVLLKMILNPMKKKKK